MQFPIHKYTASVLEDPEPLALCSSKPHGLSQRRRKKAHDAVRSLIMFLQPLRFALRELCAYQQDCMGMTFIELSPNSEQRCSDRDPLNSYTVIENRRLRENNQEHQPL